MSIEIFIFWGSSSEPGARPTRYTFGTESERAAFLHGVEEAEGWMGYEVVDGPDWIVNAEGEVVSGIDARREP